MPELPSDASQIPQRPFSVARRGYDQTEVRAYLHQLAETVGRLQRAEAALLERAERAEARADLAERLDEHRLIELVGEETARVLEAAKAAATEITTKGEERAARLVRDAQEELAKQRAALEAELAERREVLEAESSDVLERAETELARQTAEAEVAANALRAEANAELERLRTEAQTAHERATADAEATLEAARQEGRRMVAEAQAVRERVLRDLARRRHTARKQVEQLNAGRERLVEAYGVVRQTVEQAMHELTVALPEARVAAEAAARRVDEETEATVEQLEAELALARDVELPLVDLGDDLTVDDDDVPPSEGPSPSGGGSAEAVAPPAAAPAAAPTPEPGEAVVDRNVDIADDPVDRAAHDYRPEAKAAEPDPMPRRLPRPQPVEPKAPVGVTASEDTEIIERRSSSLRLFRRRELPVDMKGVAEEVLVPVEAAAEFEEVRVVEPEPADQAPTEYRAEGSASDEAHSAEAGAERRPEPSEGTAEPDVAAEAEGDDEVAPVKPTVDDLFARIRAEREGAVVKAHEVLAETADEPVAAPGDDEGEAPAAAAEPVDAPGSAPVAEPEPVGDAALIARRDRELGPVERDLAKRLKRVLADEQNEVLDLLRRARPKSVDDVLPAPAEHSRPYAEAAVGLLADAATAGGALVPEGAAGAVACDDLADELSRHLVQPLRERVDRSFADAEGDVQDVSERVRALYREWKGQRITDAVRHFSVAAYARGVFSAAPEGCALRWVVDTGGDPCPDADDNALAGAIVKGTAFPTGDLVPPAHPGCRCIALPASQ